VLSHGIDITEQTDAEEKLHALMRQRESILASVGDGIWGLDIHGNLTFCNETGASMFGYTVDEIIGQNTHDLFTNEGRCTPYPYEDCPIQKRCTRKTMRVDNEVFWRKTAPRSSGVLARQTSA